jgi:hypothetical protein
MAGGADGPFGGHQSPTPLSLRGNKATPPGVANHPDAYAPYFAKREVSLFRYHDFTKDGVILATPDTTAVTRGWDCTNTEGVSEGGNTQTTA